ncbi:class I adenylate-forming enzyme family protein [Burkholderia cepacia]|uniref:class I adenylate-forming enzyme family protein n=1 Tax=Burkholderia cepacia TaxID=292 RepID=UPI00158BB3C5|nr:class I adenylate-forming enzyme family protein [Burkholderia cepacia]
MKHIFTDDQQRRSFFESMNLGYRSVSELFFAQSASKADKPFLILESLSGHRHQVSNVEMSEHVERTANLLTNRGIGATHRVILHCGNELEFVSAFLACLKLSVVVVTTNTRLTAPEFEYCLEHSGASFVLTQQRFSEVVRSARLDEKYIIWLDASPTPAPSTSADTAALVHHSEQRASDILDLAVVQYTSGTTGRPKGVRLTRANLVYGAYAAADTEGLTEADTVLVHLPLFHINALCWSLLGVIWAGATLVLMDGFSPEFFWRAAIRNRCTWAAMIAYSIAKLRDHPVPEKHHFRCWGWGLSDPEVDTHFGVATIPWYGMTETIAPAVIGIGAFGANPVGSMGRPSPHVRIRLVDANEAELTDNRRGQIQISGVPGISLFDGYLDDPDATAKAFDEQGWFSTGDFAGWVEGGYLRYAGRLKDLFRVGGEMVSPVEIEVLVKSIPGVQDVGVVSAPHRTLGEVPVLAVVPNSTVGDLESFAQYLIERCTEALASYKVPRTIFFRTALPHSTLHKVDRKALKLELEATRDTRRFSFAK